MFLVDGVEWRRVEFDWIRVQHQQHQQCLHTHTHLHLVPPPRTTTSLHQWYTQQQLLQCLFHFIYLKLYFIIKFKFPIFWSETRLSLPIPQKKILKIKIVSVKKNTFFKFNFLFCFFFPFFGYNEQTHLLVWCTVAPATLLLNYRTTLMKHSPNSLSLSQ